MLLFTVYFLFVVCSILVYWLLLLVLVYCIIMCFVHLLVYQFVLVIVLLFVITCCLLCLVLAVGCTSGVVLLYEVERAEKVHQFNVHSAVTTMRWQYIELEG